MTMGTWPASDPHTRVPMPHVSPGQLVAVYVVISTLCLSHSDAVLSQGNPDAKRLYDDLLSNYNKLVRPVQNTTDPLTVRIKLKLSQLIDVVSILLFSSCLCDSSSIPHPCFFSSLSLHLMVMDNSVPFSVVI